MKIEKAIFAAGCFWGVEEAFRKTPGVLSTRVGYTGGHLKNATYEQACAGDTGQAEAVEITYDAKKIFFDDLLKIFWESHDPTTMNRQGPDVGAQYRSAIFYLTPEQKAQAEESKKQLDLSGKFNVPIVTEIIAASEFYPAEDYHQQYLAKRGVKVCH